MTDPPPIVLALAGIGKIARDQHLPALARDPRFRLAATVSRNGRADGVPGFATVAEAKAAVPELTAVSICTPPKGRLELVEEALAAGLDVMLEKPPAGSISEADAIVAAAAATGRVLFLTWHSREAAGVAPACRWLAGRRLRAVTVTWKEDVRVWHPGQEWIWDPGIGVFDPGINALSVVTRLLPGPVLAEEARLRFPANRAGPIAADLALRARDGTPVTCAFDFDQRGPQSWDIAVETDGGLLTLSEGGGRWFVDGAEQPGEGTGEYPGLYDRFARAVAARETDADLSPFRLVADCFQLAEREAVAPFEWDG